MFRYRKHAHLLLNDSPNFDYDHIPSIKSSETASSSLFQWPSLKNQSIPSSAFYSKSHCDTTLSVENSSDKPTQSVDHHADLYRKSRSKLLDPSDREHYEKELAKINAKQTVTTGGGSSLLSALDEDYGIRAAEETNVDHTADLLKTTSSDYQNDRNSDMFSSFKDGNTEQTTEIQEQSNEDSEECIPCTPPPEKSLKRKAGTDKKQKKITDIYQRLNVNP